MPSTKVNRMIRSILVGLDLDSDTSIAIQYALKIAERCQAHVTGLALIDSGSIEASARGGGIGSTYLGRRVERKLGAETRDLALELTGRFRTAAAEAGIEVSTRVEEGDPIENLVEMMGYHDLLVLGKDPHFFYSHPRQMPQTLYDIVEKTVGPTLIVTDTYREIRRVVVAFDASRPATKSLHGFTQGAPFGTALSIVLLHVYEKGEKQASHLALGKAREYMALHGLHAETLSIQSDDTGAEILETLASQEADLLVAGAHVVSPLFRFGRRSTTSAVLETVPVPLWLDH